MPRIPGNFSYLLVLVDTFAWTEEFPARTGVAAEVAKVLLRHISQSGVPRIPTSRNGPASVSQVKRG